MGTDDRYTLFCSAFLRGLRYDASIAKGAASPHPCADLFVFASRDIHYPHLVQLLNKLKNEDPMTIMDMAMYIRSPRGGKGERLVGRYMFQWLLINFPTVLENNLGMIPEHGRWDDLLWLFPGMLKLEELDYVRRNYICVIGERQLAEAQKAQRSVVKYLCDNLLKCYRDFGLGKPVGLLPKWLPTEGDRLDRQHHLVAQICTVLNISLHDYRVIYVTPMRRVSRVTESLMCKKNWDELIQDEIPAGCKRKHRLAFKRHFGPRTTPGESLTEPSILVEKCIATLLNTPSGNSKVSIDAALERDWALCATAIRKFSKASCSVVLDTDGTMYGLHGRSRLVSKAIAIALILSQMNVDEQGRYTVSVFTKTRGFREIFLRTNQSLLEQVSTLRMTFTGAPSVAKLLKYADAHRKSSQRPPKTVIYFSANGCTDFAAAKKALLDGPGPRVIVIALCSTTFNYRETGRLVRIQGFREDIMRYLLAFGDFDPQVSLLSDWKKGYSQQIL